MIFVDFNVKRGLSDLNELSEFVKYVPKSVKNLFILFAFVDEMV
jgi:hypothetical protein